MDYGHVGSIYSDKMQQHYLKYWIQNEEADTTSPAQAPSTSTTNHLHLFVLPAVMHFQFQCHSPTTPLSHIYILIHNLHIYFLDRSPPKLRPSNPQTPHLAHPRAPLAKGKTAMVSHTQHWCLLSCPEKHTHRAHTRTLTFLRTLGLFDRDCKDRNLPLSFCVTQ